MHMYVCYTESGPKKITFTFLRIGNVPPTGSLLTPKAKRSCIQACNIRSTIELQRPGVIVQKSECNLFQSRLLVCSIVM